MSKEAIEKLVERYLKGRSITFSDSWRRELVERVVTLQDRQVISLNKLTDEQRAKIKIDVEITHEKMLLKLPRGAEKWLRSRYRTLNPSEVEEIAAAAFDIWREEFKPERMPNLANPEFSFLQRLTRNEANDHIKKYYPKLYNKKYYPKLYNDKRTRALRAVNVPLDEEQDLTDPKDYLDNDDETLKDARAEMEDLDKQFVDNKGVKLRPVKFGEDLFPHFSFVEVFKYYSLTQKLAYAVGYSQLKARVVRVDGEPAYTEIIQPEIAHQRDNESLMDIREELTAGSHSFEMLSMNSTTTYYRRRWEILRSTVIARRM